MSNLEDKPPEITCESAAAPQIEIMTAREVPLGGLRAMTVRRTLPQRQRSLIGAWCFVDHYGPDPVDDTGGMNVAPHPHTGLQTVSWLFEGEIEHRDSAGQRLKGKERGAAKKRAICMRALADLGGWLAAPVPQAAE